MRLVNLVLLLSLVSIVGAQEADKTPTMTREERIVRNAYINLTAAAQVGVLWHAIELPEGQAKLGNRLSVSEALDRQLHFDLTDFKVGELRQVGKASSASLVTGPVGSLGAQYHEVPIENVLGENERFNLVYADVTLKSASESQHSSARLVPIHKVSTVKEFVHALRQPDNGGDWTRYASYSVVAKLGERSISYRATFLFSGHDTTEEMLPLDYATSMNITPFIKLQVCPAAIATTVFKEITEAGAWVREHNACRCTKVHDEGNSRDRDNRSPRTGAPYAVWGDANRE